MAAPIRIGTRGSKLALWQAHWVRSQLERAHPGRRFEPLVIKTRGDRILDVPLAKVGGKGLFVKEIEEALLDGRVDLAVHSMKDMPAEMPAGLKIGPVPQREDPRDVLISADGKPLADLPAGARIGTSSLRRGAQLLGCRPDLEITTLRGNLDTRLRKLAMPEERLDAIVLAAAGVKRLGLAGRVTQYLAPEVMLPAVAQGALCIQVRENDDRVEPLTAALDDAPTRTTVLGERAFLRRLGGSCQVPVAGHGRIENGVFHIEGLIAGLDGRRVLRAALKGDPGAAESLGCALAEALLARGGREILESLETAAEENEDR